MRIGRVNGVHGIRGEFKVFLYNQASDLVGRTVAARLISPTGQQRSVSITLRPGGGKRILASVPGLEDREQAALLDGWEVVVAAADLPPPEPGAWYHRDLLGLPVQTVSGRPLGRIVEIFDTAEVDVWLLRDGEIERALPVLARNLVQVRITSPELPGLVVVQDDAVDELPPLQA